MHELHKGIMIKAVQRPRGGKAGIRATSRAAWVGVGGVWVELRMRQGAARPGPGAMAIGRSQRGAPDLNQQTVHTAQ